MSPMRNRVIYGLSGFALGLGFPTGAFLIDTFLRDLPVSLDAFAAFHRDSAAFWLLDIVPVVLLIAFGLIGAGKDREAQSVSAQKDRADQATRALASDEVFFETLVNSLPLAVVIVDGDGKIIRINAAFQRMFRYTPEELVGKDLDPLITADDGRTRAFSLTGKVLSGETIRDTLVRRKKDGLPIDVNVHAVPVLVGGRRVGALAIYEDVTERVHVHNQLIHLLEKTDRLASTDPLTGLYNRRAITGLAEAEISRAQRDGLPICLMLIDVDVLKTINDRYGHPAGDQALELIALLIKANKRDRDVLGRWGGDEFIMVLPETGPADGEKVGVRLCDLIRDSYLELEDGRRIELNLSVGVCGWDTGSDRPVTGEALFQQADKALMAAKTQGRSRTVFLPFD
ncbi:MAG TPA: sensor domain-containing diguanylate cyclase [Anaerolineales bacterium]|nr:sensor domain-containing diguanylate cyclase [Anaerolineales bacterium]